ncbi:glycosyltransferase [Marixanthomonas ophiurae]|uniref:glycosyltransferase n=1 Tax=Marixanthomonas ophiurae TaxID=387659 RepID=UPI0011C04039|nr:glycosyltransferase [Marixanthomonas ophiurae]
MLKYNYDIKTFLFYFFTSFFSKKHIVHITGGCNYMVLAFPFKTKVLTIHDLYHFKSYKGLKGIMYDFFYYNLPLRFSDEIIVVSDNTRDEILKNFKIKKDKVKVLHNPIVIPFKKIQKRERNISKETPLKILQIGSKSLKNYERLIFATKDMQVEYNFIHADKKQIESLIERENIENKSNVLSSISDNELYKQYFENDILFFASEAEGFGLPIIEAQVFDMPVITSNIPPMNTIGKGAILVDPFDVDSIKKGFLKLYNPSIVSELSKIANKNVVQYHPEQVSLEYLDFYKSIS